MFAPCSASTLVKPKRIPGRFETVVKTAWSAMGRECTTTGGDVTAESAEARIGGRCPVGCRSVFRVSLHLESLPVATPHAREGAGVHCVGERMSMDLLQLVRGCTFDDFLLTPQYGLLPRRDPNVVDLSARFSEHLRLKRPLVSANMDTVTRSAMAVVLAEEGGLV